MRSVSTQCLHPEAAKIAAAHRELTDWIKANPAEARQLVVAELKALTTKEPKAAVLDKALARMIVPGRFEGEDCMINRPISTKQMLRLLDRSEARLAKLQKRAES